MSQRRKGVKARIYRKPEAVPEPPQDDPPAPPDTPDVPPRQGYVPVICGAASGRAGRVSAGFRAGICDRCSSKIEINLGVLDRHHRQGELCEFVCQHCWTVADRQALAAMRKA